MSAGTSVNQTMNLDDIAMKQDAFSSCHPAVNFAYFVGAMGFSMVFQHPAYVIASVLCSSLCCLTVCGPQTGKKTILGMIPLWIILSIINPLFNTLGDTILFSLWGRPYTWEALCYGMSVSGIFVSALIWFSCYNRVITGDKLFCLFGNLAPALTLLLVMIFRLVPELLRKIRQIAGARKAIGKGANEQSPLKERIADGMVILSTLTSWALEGSVVTADSMRSRGYGSAKRSNFQIYRLTGRDRVLLALIAVFCVLIIIASATGSTAVTFIPALDIAPVSWGLPVYICYLLIPALLNLKEEFICHNLISKI